MKPIAGPREERNAFDKDARALRALASGDIGALGELYDRYAVSLLRFVRRSSSREDAEDVVQTTFLRVAATAGRFDPTRATARSWIFGIATHVLRERRRAWARLASAMGRLLSETQSSASPGGTVAAGASVDMGRALDRLSDAKRMAFVLVEVEGFTGEEAAAMLGVPLGTVWTRLHHARRELRDLLGEKVGT